jgi:hypothetical protein
MRRRGLSGRRVAFFVAAALVSGLAATPPAAGAHTVQTQSVAPSVDNSSSVEVVSSAQKYNAATVTLTTAFPGDLLVAFVGSDSPP